MKPGFLTLQRKFFDHWLWTEPRQFSRAEAWLDLLRSAAFADHSRMIRGAVVTVSRGEVVASLRYLGERWGWKKDKVNTFVRLLENATMIRRETRQQETVIILCNYDAYNIQTSASSDSEQTQTQTENRQQPDSDPTKDNKVNNGKKVGGEESPPALDFAKPQQAPFNPNRMTDFPSLLKFGRGQMPPVPDDCCEAFFDRMEADGWINKEGFPLADWRPRFRSWVKAWYDNASKPNKNNR